MLNVFDHGYVFLFCFVWPIAGYISYQRLLKRIANGENVDRGALYRSTVTGQWSLFALGVVLWSSTSRDLSLLGIQFQPGTGFFLALVAGLSVLAFLVFQIRQIASANAETLSQYTSQMQKLLPFLPSNERELRQFNYVSLTAGIVEELLWRAYFIWYLQHFVGLTFAALISGATFGLAHAYQGREQIARIALVGCAMAGLYILSGSIWIPILVHILGDMLQGKLTFEVIRRTDQPAAINS